MSQRAIQITLQQFLDDNGELLSGGKLKFYKAGLSTPQSIYTSYDKTGSRVNQVTLDSYGQIPNVLYWDQALKIEVYDQNNVLLKTFDQLSYFSSMFPFGNIFNAIDYGDGSLTSTTLLDAITQIASQEAILLITPGTWVITDNITFPSNISLQFSDGGIFQIANGITVNYSASGWGFSGPSSRIFQLVGTGKFLFNGAMDYLDPRWWGAVADGVTDNTTSFQACWDCARLTGNEVNIFYGTYMLGETYVSYGMTIKGKGATLKLLPNQPKFTRLMTTQNNLWVVTTQTEDSPILKISGITFDGNQDNQGVYTGFEKEQQQQLFLVGSGTTNANERRLRVIVENCVFKNGCSDGIGAYSSVDLKVSNCFFWNMFRGGVVVTGANTVVNVSNISCGGNLWSSFFQAEIDGSVNSKLNTYITLTNSYFDHLVADSASGSGLDIAVGAESQIAISNCIFKAGIDYLYLEDNTSSAEFSNCIFRQLRSADFARFGKSSFNNCKYLNTTANTGLKLIGYRGYSRTNLELNFNGCQFDSEFDPFSHFTELTVSAVAEISNGVFEFTTSTAHGIPAPGNYTQDLVYISALTDDGYNKWYFVDSTPSTTKVRVSVTEYLGVPALKASPKLYVGLATNTYFATAVEATEAIAPGSNNVLRMNDCTVSERLKGAVILNQGGIIKSFSGNNIRSAYAGILASAGGGYTMDVSIGPNTIDTGLLFFVQGNVAGQLLKLNNSSVPAKSGYMRYFAGATLLDSEVVGKLKLVSNITRPKTTQQVNSFMTFEYSSGAVGTPIEYCNDGTTWSPIKTSIARGVTGSRPTLSTIDVGVQYMDTTLDADGKPIWWTGTGWIDATGASV